jgi:hypothetical protein
MFRLIPMRSPPQAGVSKDFRKHGALWFETRAKARSSP